MLTAEGRRQASSRERPGIRPPSQPSVGLLPSEMEEPILFSKVLLSSHCHDSGGSHLWLRCSLSPLSSEVGGTTCPRSHRERPCRSSDSKTSLLHRGRHCCYQCDTLFQVKSYWEVQGTGDEVGLPRLKQPAGFSKPLPSPHFHPPHEASEAISLLGTTVQGSSGCALRNGGHHSWGLLLGLVGLWRATSRAGVANRWCLEHALLVR